jgi:hypothetical protein
MADPAYIVDGVLTDGEAWVAIETDTSSGSTALFNFTSTDDGQVGDFSQYMDLVLVFYVNSTGGYSKLNFNSDTTSNYAYQYLYGNGANDLAGSGTTTYFDGAWYNGTTKWGAAVVHLFDINSGKYKSGITQVASDADGSGNVVLTAVTWKSQAPITEIDIIDAGTANFADGSMVSLFGILPSMLTTGTVA